MTLCARLYAKYLCDDSHFSDEEAEAEVISPKTSTPRK